MKNGPVLAFEYCAFVLFKSTAPVNSVFVAATDRRSLPPSFLKRSDPRRHPAIATTMFWVPSGLVF